MNIFCTRATTERTSLLVRLFDVAGIPIKWTNSGFIKPGTPNSANPIPPGIIHATALMSDLTDKAKAVTKKLLGDDGELVVMRLHTQSSEYVVAPSHESTLVVVQNAHSAEQKPLVAIAEAEQMAKLESEKKGGGGDKK